MMRLRPGQALLAVPNVTAHPSTASVTTSVLLYTGPVLCDFNVPVKGLTSRGGLVVLCAAEYDDVISCHHRSAYLIVTPSHPLSSSHDTELMPMTHLPEIGAETGTRKPVSVSDASDMQFSTDTDKRPLRQKATWPFLLSVFGNE